MAATTDREKDHVILECPFLLRIFARTGGHHPTSDFTVKSVPEADELQLYTWRNATLAELAQLIQEVIPEAQQPDARISFRLIYLDSDRGVYYSRDIGRVMNMRETDEQTKTLEECQFYIGDYLDVAIYTGPRPMPRFGSRGSDRLPPRNTDRSGRPMRYNGGAGIGRDRERDRDSRFIRDSRPPFGGRRDRP